jgi:hypothetical protein
MDKKTYEKKIYEQLNISDLILFSIYLIKKNREVCTFERLVAECFNNFPKVFCFRRYPNWPDSGKLDRPIRTFRERGLVIGGMGGRYSPGEIMLTSFGEEKAKQIKLILTGKKTILSSKKKNLIPRSIDEKLIYQLKINPYFKKFLSSQNNFSITEPEFRNILRCTLETPMRILKQNLQYLKKYCRSL